MGLRNMIPFPGLSSAGTGLPGGSPPQFQYNYGGAFAGASQWEYDFTTGRTIGPGIGWTARAAAEASLWRSVAYGNGLFVAVATAGTNRVMTSPDGITWTARSAAEANQWNSVTYGNGLFVATALYGSTNQVMTSPDGITWTARAVPQTCSWNSITYGNGLFVAVSYDGLGTGRVMTSPDGITWTGRTASEATQWRSVTYGNGLFVAVAYSGTNRVMTSPDGITWTARSASAAGGWFSVTYGNGLFVAVDSGNSLVMTSPDGITWTSRTASENSEWGSVTYGNGLFVAVALSGTNRVMTSPDGITWTSRSASEANIWECVVYANGVFVAVGANGTNRVMTSGVKLEHTLYQNNSTGSGPVVRQTSPTLITPVLGVASATSLACPTFTSSAAMGFTPAAGSGFNINLSTTGDFAVNTNKLFVDTSTGNVGIGTTGPNTKLHVFQGTSNSNGQLQVGGGTAIGNQLSYEAIGSGRGAWSDLNNAGGSNNQLNIGFGAITSGVPANVVATFNQAGNVGIGTTGPSAVVHLKAGTATANTAPLKLTTGTNLTTPEAGAMEYNNTFHLTNSDATRRHVVVAASATKTTAGAPYTNDGYVTVNIGGTDVKVMTTA